jgi:transposase InsO family protein
MLLDERADPVRFPIRGQDTKFTSSFDEVFKAEGVRNIRSPARTPRANAFAERFVLTIRRERLDRMLIFGRRHLETAVSGQGTLYLFQRPKSPFEDQLTCSQRPPSFLICGDDDLNATPDVVNLLGHEMIIPRPMSVLVRGYVRP